MRIIKAAGALVLLATLLIGVPYALFLWGQPLSLLDVEWSTALLRPDDGRIVLGLLSVAGWLAWLVLAATTLGELITTLSRGAVRIRLPGTAWLRPGVAALVGAVLAPLVATQLSAAPDSGAPPPLASVSASAATSDEESPPPVPAEREAPVAASSTAYTVAHGDELWSLAERFLGSGDRWRDIVALNPGMSPEGHLAAGDRILLPDAPAAPVASAGVADGGTVTVEAGDTLWDLADEHLGDPHLWPELHAANLEQIADPDEIDVGWELQLPEVASAVAEDPVPGTPSDEPATAQSDETETVGVDEESAGEQASSEPSAEASPADPEPTTVEPGSSFDDGAPPSVPAPRDPLPPPTGSTTNRPSLDAGGAEMVDLLGPVGAVLAAGIFAGVAARRRSQLLQRAVGRRLLPVRPELQRFWASLTRRSTEAEPTAAGLGSTGIILGWDGTQDVQHDLESARCTLVEGTQEHAAGLVAATVTSLMCAPWSTTVDVVVVEPGEDWEASFDEPRIREIGSHDEGLLDLQKLCAGRRIEMGSGTLAELRRDPDLASAWTPVVYLFREPLPAAGVAHVAECLSLGRVGVSVMAPVADGTTPSDGWETVRIESEEAAATVLGGQTFVPQLLGGPARRAVVELFAAATSTETEPAPWWDEDPLPPNVTVLPRNPNDPTKDSAMPARSADPTHPTLLLLGPVDLLGITGSRPNRSVTPSLECCAWLLANPGATPSRMMRDLAIAEATRRSNVSRLRSWLGADEDGEPYLPDAYSGHLELHPEVSSDWEQFQLLLSGGISHASNHVLVEALRLVRGEPLAGVAFQWPWAEHIRTDMVSMVTDAAAVLADRALEQGDVATAHWAVEHGRLAAGEDEILSVREIHLLALSGDRTAVDQAVRRLTRSARAAGRDLSAEAVRRIQLALNLAVTGDRAN